MFKKLLFLSAFMLSLLSYGQQVQFGLQGGYLNMEAKSSSSIGNVSSSGSSSGYFVGALAEFGLSDAVRLQPSVNYANADEVNFLMIPVVVQYYIQDSGFYFLAGPQGTFVLDKLSINGVNLINTFGLDLALGVGYQIDSNFFLEAKYSLELTNRYSDEIRNAAETQGAKVQSKFNALSLGVGYKF